MTSPYAFYQYFVNQADARRRAAAARLQLPRPRGDRGAGSGDRRAPGAARGAASCWRTSSRRSSTAAPAADGAVAASEALFGSGRPGAIDAATLEAALGDLPRAEVERPLPVGGGSAGGHGTGAEPRPGAAHRGEGGAYLNNERVTDGEAAADEASLLHGRWLLLRRGKRALAVVGRRRGARLAAQCLSAAPACVCVLGDHLLGHLVRHLRVVVDLRGEAPTALGDARSSVA